ncbi:LacI family DNA-binding transcriptional regulator [Silvimonas amylolytica]|uniref:LacI family transcriptional regulator n=1 Tax=Silvimonas amylolytica TaxID=449663 RepID=A0ABQ2PHM8_9NEIS|nr:LacI family DNA-binding transcriptional regulator [Silvimonas amylolytica]GGP24977.1 LacI family transcriptional regulator [Silvimonas amylolytica]
MAENENVARPDGFSGVVTMNDVAAAAGLSRTTVSKYFNGSATLKPDTREKIERACRALNYVPDLHAVSLVTGRSNLVGVVLPFIAEPFFGKVLQLMEREAAALGLQIVIQASNNDTRREAAALMALRAMKVHGIILTPIESDDNRALLASLQKEMRIVFLDSFMDENCHFVMNDNQQSIGLMVNYLLSRNVRPAYLGTPRIANPSRPERLAGYVAAMKAAGETPEVIPVAVDTPTWQFEAFAYEQLLNWCGQGGLRDSGAGGIMCTTDRMAFGAAKALRKFGRHPGKDMLLAGHDNLDICEYMDPQLTTVHQDIERISHAAMHFIQLDPAELGGRFYQQRFPGRLVIRESA